MTTFAIATTCPINLLPARRRKRALRSQLLRRWLTGLGAWCLVLVVASLMVLVSTRSSSATVNAFENTADALAASQSQLATIDSQRTLYRKKVAAARAVGHHPDWSILLSLLARERGNTITFDTIDIVHSRPQPAAAPSRGTSAKSVKQADQFTLTLSGFADTVASINAFAVRLEDSGLFESVSRLDAGGTTERGSAFRIVCTLNDATEPRSKP